MGCLSCMLGISNGGGGWLSVRRISCFCKRVYQQILGSPIGWWWYAFVFGENHTVRVHPLPVLLVYGLAGILIDLDHLIIKEVQRIRPLHLEYWFIVGVVCIGYHTYVYRRVHQARMKKE